jgi:2-succinyl-5-enolpyruvyl-6-hydroxy-3-cyclohexene-1-carboxylate synthase
VAAREGALRDRLAAACRPATAWFEGTALRHVLSDSAAHTCFVVGNSLCVRDIDTFGAWAARDGLPASFVTRRGVSGIDGALAHAFGLAQTLPADVPLCVLLGDLTFLHDLQSLRLLAAQGRAVELFVLDNDGGEIFRQLPIAQSPGRAGALLDRLFRTPQSFPWSPAAQALGARVWQCEGAGALTSARAAARAARAPGVDLFWLPFSADARRARREVLAGVLGAGV